MTPRLSVAQRAQLDNGAELALLFMAGRGASLTLAPKHACFQPLKPESAHISLSSVHIAFNLNPVTVRELAPLYVTVNGPLHLLPVWKAFLATCPR